MAKPVAVRFTVIGLPYRLHPHASLVPNSAALLVANCVSPVMSFIFYEKRKNAQNAHKSYTVCVLWIILMAKCRAVPQSCTKPSIWVSHDIFSTYYWLIILTYSVYKRIYWTYYIWKKNVYRWLSAGLSCLVYVGVWDKRRGSEIDLSRTPGCTRQAPGVWDQFIPA